MEREEKRRQYLRRNLYRYLTSWLPRSGLKTYPEKPSCPKL
jgi:hypothetical protein